MFREGFYGNAVLRTDLPGKLVSGDFKSLLRPEGIQELLITAAWKTEGILLVQFITTIQDGWRLCSTHQIAGKMPYATFIEYSLPSSVSITDSKIIEAGNTFVSKSGLIGIAPYSDNKLRFINQIRLSGNIDYIEGKICYTSFRDKRVSDRKEKSFSLKIHPV